MPISAVFHRDWHFYEATPAKIRSCSMQQGLSVGASECDRYYHGLKTIMPRTTSLRLIIDLSPLCYCVVTFAVSLMAQVSPSPTAPPHPLLVSRKIYQRQTSQTCGWVDGQICTFTIYPFCQRIPVPFTNTFSPTASPVTCNSGATCASNTVNSVHFCCGDINNCVLPTACLDQTALAGCNSSCEANLSVLKW